LPSTCELLITLGRDFGLAGDRVDVVELWANTFLYFTITFIFMVQGLWSL